MIENMASKFTWISFMVGFLLYNKPVPVFSGASTESGPYAEFYVGGFFLEQGGTKLASGRGGGGGGPLRPLWSPNPPPPPPQLSSLN